MHLCCDLGGTNARFAVLDPDSKNIVFRMSSKVRDHHDFYALFRQTLQAYGNADPAQGAITNTTLGVAGVTQAKQVRPTNIDGWEISVVTVEGILRQFGHAPFASILNDFEALGYGVLYSFIRGFSEKDYVPVFGRFDPSGARQDQQHRIRSLICGPGTGLGLSCVVEGLTRAGLPYVITSEGGHHSLAPESTDEYRFLAANGQFQGKRSYEELLSGPGLKNIYCFYRQADPQLSADDAPSPEKIVLAARQGETTAAKSVAFFCRLLAEFCGNVTLTFSCDRSVFLWGGVLSGMPLELIKSSFEQYFGDRCRHAERVSSVSVVLLQDHELPLHGCGYRARLEDKNRAGC